MSQKGVSVRGLKFQGQQFLTGKKDGFSKKRDLTKSSVLSTTSAGEESDLPVAVG